MAYIVTGKSVDLPDGQQTVSDTLHKKGKPQKLIAKVSGSSQKEQISVVQKGEQVTGITASLTGF